MDVKGLGSMSLKFDPTINLGHILTAGAMLATGLVAYSTLEKRVTVQEEKAAIAVQMANERSAETKDQLKEIKSDLRDLARSVDSLKKP